MMPRAVATSITRPRPERVIADAPTCWFCNRRPADPRLAWTMRLRWRRPKSLPPPVDYDATIVATTDIKTVRIRLPRCAQCRRRARLPGLLNTLGSAVGGGFCLFGVALWAHLAGFGLPRIEGTWIVLALIGTVAGCLAGGLMARLWHPKPSRHRWGDHPSLRVLAAEGWTSDGG